MLKKLVFPLSTIVLLFSTSMTEAKTPKTDKEKASYAIGQQIGSSLKSQNLDVDTSVLADSIKDVLAGNKSKLKPEEMQEAMTKLQSKMMEKQKAEGATNKKTGDEFLEKNKKEKDVKVTASGLQYKVLKEGKGDSPKAEDTVKVHYKGTLLNGSEFDSSYKRNEPAEFPVKGVIPGWTEALQMMKPGEKRQLWIPSNLAYGEMGRPGIPPSSVLVFEVELIEVKPAPAAKK